MKLLPDTFVFKGLRTYVTIRYTLVNNAVWFKVILRGHFISVDNILTNNVSFFKEGWLYEDSSAAAAVESKRTRLGDSRAER